MVQRASGIPVRGFRVYDTGRKCAIIGVRSRDVLARPVELTLRNLRAVWGHLTFVSLTLPGRVMYPARPRFVRNPERASFSYVSSTRQLSARVLPRILLPRDCLQRDHIQEEPVSELSQ